MSELDGGLEGPAHQRPLPPLVGVRKRIQGARGETRVGRLPGVPFRVEGRSLVYHAPLSGFVDVLEPEGEYPTYARC